MDLRWKHMMAPQHTVMTLQWSRREHWMCDTDDERILSLFSSIDTEGRDPTFSLSLQISVAIDVKPSLVCLDAELAKSRREGLSVPSTFHFGVYAAKTDRLPNRRVRRHIHILSQETDLRRRPYGD